MTPAKTKPTPVDTSSSNGAAHPICSEMVEEWLRGRGVKFKPCRNIPLSSVDHAGSRRNQARREAIDSSVVETYVQALRNGDKFPPIVVIASNAGKYTIVDGNHRDEAYVRAHRDDVCVYEIDPDTDSVTVELLTAEANVRHGLRTDAEWRGHQAAYLIANGVDLITVASATGLSKSAIESAQRAQKADVRAARAGIKGWKDIPMTTRAMLGPIKSDPVFLALAALVAEYRPSMQDISDAVRGAKVASTEAEAMRIIGDLEETITARRRITGQTKRTVLSSPRMRIVTALGAVLAINVEDVPRMFRTQRERDEIKDRSARAALVLMEIEEALRDGDNA